MREAIGGTMLLYILIPVLFIFIVFMAFIMNYASAYRASNYVVSMIEVCDADIDHCENLIRENGGGSEIAGLDTILDDIKKRYHYNNGVDFCYVENKKGTVYRVSLGVYFHLPLIGRIGIYKVVSESKTIYDVMESENNGVFGNGIGECPKEG